MMGPVEFQAKFLGRKLWGKQREMVTAISTKRKVSVKGCHGSGKTFAVAGCVPYEMLGNEDAMVLIIAPTLRQVKNFWSEIHTALAAMPVSIPEPTTVGWEISEKCKAIGFSSSKGVNAQGYHGKRVLIIKDEAIGISQEVHDAIDGIRMAGDVREVSLCNPTVPQGPVYEDFTRLRGQAGHECITISAFDTPNLEGLTIETLMQLPDDQLDYAPAPWLTRRRAVVEMYHKWGPTNPRFMARVLGEFPTQATDAVFQLAWIEAAGKEADEATVEKLFAPGAFIQIGVDVAGPGADETAAYARIGGLVLGHKAWSKPDPLDDFLMWIGQIQLKFREVPIVILGDTVGIGYHFMRAIARHGFEVHPFIAGARPRDPVMFTNYKAESYWACREWMREGALMGLDDEDTKAQLSDIRYKETTRGQIEIEHKADARKRGSSSPDRAEALIIAFARPQPADEVYQIAERVSISRY